MYFFYLVLTAYSINAVLSFRYITIFTHKEAIDASNLMDGRCCSTSRSLLLCDNTRLRKALALHVKKTNNSSKRSARNRSDSNARSTSGFGGAVAALCPCGSGMGYMKCCGLLHKSNEAFGVAAAEQVVRARYSAYAKREVDFIVASTHPLNKSNFMSDVEQWKSILRCVTFCLRRFLVKLRKDCYNDFELNKCSILSEDYIGEGINGIALVKFCASMKQRSSRNKAAFVETSTFKRHEDYGVKGRAWLYFDGVVEPLDFKTSVAL